MKGLPPIGTIASLRDLFATARQPQPQPTDRRRNTVAPALMRKDADGKPTSIEIAPPLMARPIACAGCGLARGTLRKAREGVYVHKGCTPRPEV